MEWQRLGKAHWAGGPRAWAVLLAVFHTNRTSRLFSSREPRAAEASAASPLHCGCKQETFVGGYLQPELAQTRTYITEVVTATTAHSEGDMSVIPSRETTEGVPHLGPGLSCSMENSKGCVRCRGSSGADTSRLVAAAAASITCWHHEVHAVRGCHLAPPEPNSDLMILFAVWYCYA
jgi:hypothetical protein